MQVKRKIVEVNKADAENYLANGWELLGITSWTMDRHIGVCYVFLEPKPTHNGDT
jgi:hypothetical protein